MPLRLLSARPRPVPASCSRGPRGGRPAAGPGCSRTRGPAAAAVLAAPSAVPRPVSRVSCSGTASRSFLVAGTARVCESSSPCSVGCPLGVCVVFFFVDWLFGFGGDLTPQRVCLLLTSALGCPLSPRPVGASLGRLVVGAPAGFLRGALPAPLLSFRAGLEPSARAGGGQHLLVGRLGVFCPLRCVFSLLLVSRGTHVRLVFAQVTPASVSARVRMPDAGFASVGTV